MNGEFRFAPPPRLIAPRQWAVPADLRRISARLDFDTVSQQAHGSATVLFRTGEERAGFPIFDLRQPILAATLDGAALSPALLAHHRFGARAEQALRLVRRPLAPGSIHRLGLRYRIEAPPLKASTAGGYQPALEWGSGSVNFNFGFTDLGGGRYLEAWIPANLIYDRFALTLEVRVSGGGCPHVLITNGEVRQLAPNHWKVRYAPSFTALSPLLQLHPANAVESADRTVMLPVSGRPLAIEAHKFRQSPIRLSEQLDHIARWLRRNETEIGAYPHGDRFIAFLHRGGMEYDGACTAAPDALEHEVFHSWWARGLKPASQNDGWIDEAWTSFHDDGTPARRRFDFRERPECLSPRSPWNRATPRASYRQGSRFFEGLAVHLGLDLLRGIMREIYRLHAPGFITTAQIEAHLLDRTGDDPLIERAFRHWVWGR